MDITRLAGVRIAGIASAVPEQVATLADAARLFGGEDALRVSESTGIKTRHIAPPGLCASDLCLEAAERLLRDLNWSRDSIDVLIYLSQSPDYLIPATSCCLHGRLHLPKTCAAFDIGLGCSGYVYGLWVAASLLASRSCRRVLLLVGEIASRGLSPYDRAVAMLFGDAGTATALESDPNAAGMFFTLGTDGTGYRYLIVPAGGHRQRHSESTGRRTAGEDGVIRCGEDLYMNGPEVFAFTLREVPSMIRRLLSAAGWTPETVDAFVMHQANRFILQHIAKKLRVPEEKMVLAMEDYGNTSSASVPLALSHALRQRLGRGDANVVLAGFGVGFSWGAVALRLGPLVCPEILQVTESAIWDQSAETVEC
ncbi:MAG TPA: ketoacyl-ACP synthase III [Bryobacteraceae bacterium]|jgi:3-oxoacyl-[acyl-carrier-protein] synthase-3|nr:ketoacyl-ACP synthase III [Bryobacteraceae bacterium]